MSLSQGMSRSLPAVALGAFVALGAASANAALVNVPASFVTSPTAKVENAAGTLTAVVAGQYLTPPDPSNVASVANINAAGFFGVTTWESNGQLQIDPANDQSGTWSISNVDFTTYNYAIVFKDGNDTNLVAFLFNEQFTSGAWSTPFTDPPFDFPGRGTSRDVSHYTIVRTTSSTTPNPTPVPAPEPMSLALFGVALAGLGAAARRRRSH